MRGRASSACDGGTSFASIGTMMHRIGTLAVAATLFAACTTIHRVPRPATIDDLHAIDSGGAAYDSSLLRGYEIQRTGTGALEGLTIGAVSGLLAGGMIGAGLGDWSSCRGECDFIPGEDAMLWGALILGAATGVVGALIGAGVRHTDRYLF